MKEFERSTTLYEKAIRLFPNHLPLKFDYGKVLFSLNKFSKAKNILTQYLEQDTINAEANILLAYIEFWDGHTSAAKQRALFIIQHYPGNA